MSNKYYIGIEIGGTKTQVVLGDSNYSIIAQYRRSVEKSKGATGILATISKGIEEVTKKYKAEAVGIGFGGPLNHKTGKIAVSNHIEGWTGFDLKKWVEEKTGLPVKIENDANTAALAEAHLGSGKEFEKVFYVTLGSGMGGGMVINKELYHGSFPGESEIGLMSYDKNGTNFESHCSGWAVDLKVSNYIKINQDSVLAQLVGNDKKSLAKYLVEAISNGDSGACLILDDTAKDIAFALSHVTHLFHPNVFVLGGGLSLIGEMLRERVEKYFPYFITKSFSSHPQITLALLGESVVCVGALILAKN